MNIFLRKNNKSKRETFTIILFHYLTLERVDTYVNVTNREIARAGVKVVILFMSNVVSNVSFSKVIIEYTWMYYACSIIIGMSI